MPSGLGSFSIDSLLGNNNSRKSSSAAPHHHQLLSRGGGHHHQPACCSCENSRKPRDNNCRCKCHDAHRPAMSAAQKERKRTTFTEQQKKGMLRVFEKHKYLDGTQREQVAAELGIEPNQVKRKWQNLRSKNKESLKSQEPNFFKSQYSFINTSNMSNMHNLQNIMQLPNNRDQLNRRHLSYSAAAMPYPAKLMSHTPAAQHLGPGHYRNNLALNHGLALIHKDYSLL